jgi:succinate dehydrogenase cytochrome b subunit
MAETPARNRPLSPHLGIYRPMLTMMMSIVHRITGGALYVGTLLLAWWLVAAATGPEAYAHFQNVATSWIGRLVLLGYTWALIHHLLGGIRHFVWDMGKGFELGKVEWAARLTLAGSILLTGVVWVVAYAMAGVI